METEKIMDVKEWLDCNYSDKVVYQKQKMSGMKEYLLSEIIEEYLEYYKERTTLE